MGCGRDDLDGGDEDGGRAEGFEPGGEVGGLMAGSGDEDAFTGERHFGSLYAPRGRILSAGDEDRPRQRTDAAKGRGDDRVVDAAATEDTF